MDFKPFKIGKYLLLERLATGGMAEVYRAKASGAGGFEKQLAIKRILPSYSSNEEFRRMFEYEARLSSMLTHANIVQIYDFVKSGETYLLAMEYVDGKNLRQLVNKAKKVGAQMPIEFGLYIINEVCKGLEYAHKKKDDLNGRPLNIIHRDMSPQNIMLSYDGAVKIVDFGIAKAKDRVDETRSGVIKGKFGYMSPEQANGEQVDHRTDIFSTGIILFELVTNKRLFAAENDMATLKQIQECLIPSAARLNPKVTPELEKILLKGLTKDLRLRYQDAGLLHRNLQEFLNKYYPSFTQKEAGDHIQKIFKDEIQQEKKRFEQIHRQSIPFSQGENKDPSGQIEEIEEALDGSVTKSEVGSKSSVTFVSQVGEPGIPVEVDEVQEPALSAGESTNPGESIGEHIGEPLVLEDEGSLPTSKSLRRDTGLSDLFVSNSVGVSQKTKVTGDEDLFKEDKMPVIENNTPTPTQPGSRSRSGITLARGDKSGSTPTPSIKMGATDPSLRANTRRRDRSISSVTQVGQAGRKNTASQSVTLMPVVETPAVRAVTEGVARAEATGSYHKIEYPEREEYFGPRRRRNPMLYLILFFILAAGVAYLYRVFLTGVPPPWMRALAGRGSEFIARIEPSPPLDSPETQPESPVERRPGGDCSVRVESDPTGAKVLVNGEERGTTFTNIAVPCNQSINLTLRLDGYEGLSQNLMVQNKTERFVKTLKRVPTGTLELTLDRNATISVDGIVVGNAEARKRFETQVRANQEHTIVFENQVLGLRKSMKVRVNPDEIARESVRLDDSPSKKR